MSTDYIKAVEAFWRDVERRNRRPAEGLTHATAALWNRYKGPNETRTEAVARLQSWAERIQEELSLQGDSSDRWGRNDHLRQHLGGVQEALPLLRTDLDGV